MYSLLLLLFASASASLQNSPNVFSRDRHQELPNESNAPGVGRPQSPAACMVDNTGDFGSNKGHIVTVEYLYEVETIFSVDSYSLNNYILDDIERAVSNALLPTLFTEQCGLSREERRDGERQPIVHGVSTFPPDRISEDVLSCVEGLENTRDKCFVAQGMTTIFVMDGTSDSEIQALVAGEIKLAMDSGAFDGARVHRDVVKISFRNAMHSQLPRAPVGMQESPEVAGTNNKSDLFVVWIVAGVIASCAVLCFSYTFLTWKKIRCREERQRMTENDENDTLVHSNNSVDLEAPPTPVRPPPKSTKQKRRPKKPLSIIAEEEEGESDVQVETAVLA